MGGLRLQPFLGTIRHLGCPTYFMTIHTIWYILGGVALLVPRFPRLKSGHMPACSLSTQEHSCRTWPWGIPL
jgi:hypothetical protein